MATLHTWNHPGGGKPPLCRSTQRDHVPLPMMIGNIFRSQVAGPPRTSQPAKPSPRTPRPTKLRRTPPLSFATDSLKPRSRCACVVLHGAQMRDRRDGAHGPDDYDIENTCQNKRLENMFEALVIRAAHLSLYPKHPKTMKYGGVPPCSNTDAPNAQEKP